MNPLTYLLRNLIRAEVARDGELTRQEIKHLSDSIQQDLDSIKASEVASQAGIKAILDKLAAAVAAGTGLTPDQAAELHQDALDAMQTAAAATQAPAT